LAIRWWWVFLAAVLLVGFLNYPLPFYVSRPGSAVELGPLITVEGGERDSQGAFMLTTVRMGQASPFWYLYAKLSPDAQLIPRSHLLLPGESNEEFTRRELMVMEQSQQVASAVAFRLAGYDVHVEQQGVLIVQTIAGSPAEGRLQAGDVVTRIDDTPIRTMQELLDYLSGKRPGEQVTVSFTREAKEQSVTLTLTELAAQPGEASRAGLGVRGSNKQTIEVPKNVTVASENIGGPSAGLMMALEIYDQLNTEWDVTRGYRIAGTGEIFADGSVGRIGGISQKIVAADTAGAEIFFAPADEAANGPSNYEEALAAAERIGTAMRIVPVKRVEDALRYLQALEPK
jgi:PDZ domain-containing protein